MGLYRLSWTSAMNFKTFCWKKRLILYYLYLLLYKWFRGTATWAALGFLAAGAVGTGSGCERLENGPAPPAAAPAARPALHRTRSIVCESRPRPRAGMRAPCVHASGAESRGTGPSGPNMRTCAWDGGARACAWDGGVCACALCACRPHLQLGRQALDCLPC